MEDIQLANGVKMPQLGMGGWAQKEQQLVEAFHIGYRLVDTAAQYGNEEEVGNAIKHAGISRGEFFVATKLWTEDVRNGRTVEAFENSLKNLRLDYVDLYLIHWPAQGFEKAWEEMERLYEAGKIRAIGVSNFQIHHLKKLQEFAVHMPVVNQVELHPYFTNANVAGYCRQNQIAVEAWCPLGGPGSGVLAEPVIARIAGEHQKSPAQVILRWQIQRGVVAIPKAARKEHMQANFQVFDFELDGQEMDLITGLDRNGRLGADPDHFDF